MLITLFWIGNSNELFVTRKVTFVTFYRSYYSSDIFSHILSVNDGTSQTWMIPITWLLKISFHYQSFNNNASISNILPEPTLGTRFAKTEKHEKIIRLQKFIFTDIATESNRFRFVFGYQITHFKSVLTLKSVLTSVLVDVV